MPKRDGTPTAKEVRLAQAQEEALAVIRTQAYSWAISVGFRAASARWHALDYLYTSLTGDAYADETPEDVAARELRARTANATMAGLEDAARRMGWNADVYQQS